jgi:2-keto-4-pentenoate hydratase/2-oxohepta-3-ene-1,7-dioic acid hydratase in catechol pathway
MRIATFRRGGGRRAGVATKDLEGVLVDLPAAAELLGRGGREAFDAPRDVMSLVRASSDAGGLFARLEDEVARVATDPSLAEARLDIKSTKLDAPLDRPGKIVCLAGNYRAHIVESGFVAPDQSDVITQQLFLKPASALTGDGDAILIRKNNVSVGWETELAVVIGRRGRDIEAGAAYDHVFGYTILNDVSERRLNSRVENRRRREMDGFLDWLAGKWFDTFAPCGPWIVTADEIPDPHDLEIKLTLNGELRQQGNTRDMIFSIPEQIAYVSSIMTLEPGDIISTGTPVGAGVGGRASLRDGDELICEIEGIGSLRNRVRCVN